MTRSEQERLPQGGPSFEPLVGALDSRRLVGWLVGWLEKSLLSYAGWDFDQDGASAPKQTKPNQTQCLLGPMKIRTGSRDFIRARVLPRIWVRPLPPRAASRLSGLVRRLRCSSLHGVLAECRANLGQGPGHALKMSIQPITNHQSPITRGL